MVEQGDLGYETTYQSNSIRCAKTAVNLYQTWQQEALEQHSISQIVERATRFIGQVRRRQADRGLNLHYALARQ